MRSLFLKIFFGFWLAMLLIGAVLVLLALTSDPLEAEMARLEEKIYAIGEQMIPAYEQDGIAGLDRQRRELDEKYRIETFLYDGRTGPLADRPAPRILHRLSRRALETSEMQVRPARHGIWMAVPVRDDYVLVARVPHPSKLERILDPRRLGLRLLVTFVVAGGICYLLARSLTSPIKKLRRATRQFADGNLATRVGVEISGHDEIADLARDFDGMAEHIESLITAQRRLHGDISHELRSPLARLNVALELARQQAGEAEAGPLDRIGLEAERLNELIGEVLTLSRLESSVNELKREPVQLDRLVARVAADAEYEANASGRSIEIVASNAVRVTGFERLLHQAIENVVRNAVRHTPEGTAVKIALRDERDRAVFTVSDHGPGVPPEELPRIFRPFYRLDAARDRQSGGSGLGLAIAERAVKLHGGEISAENAEGGGLLIRMTLPLANP